MINFEWYRSFIAVYRSGTVTGAAAARFLTQPAISQHIAALESTIGHALFQRQPRKMVPTANGRALYSRMAPAIDKLEKVSAGLRGATKTEAPSIRLGTPLDYFHEVGMEKLKDARFRLTVELGDTDKMLDSLARGKLDAVIATQQPGGTSIDHSKIGQEAFCLVAPPEMTLPEELAKPSGPKPLIERFLLEQQWISYSEDLPIIRRFWHVAFKRRPEIRPVMVLPSLLLVCKAVEWGLGVSVLPRYICHESLDAGRLRILWAPKNAVVNDLWIATRKVDRNKAEIEVLIALMRGEQAGVV